MDFGKSIYEFFKDIQVFAATIPPTIAVVFAYQQLKQMKLAEINKDRKVAVDNSINYVDRFSKTVLPHYQEYKALVKDGHIKTIDIPSTGFKNFDPVKIEDLEVKEKTEVYKSLNEVDIIAAAVLHGQVDKDICKDLFGTLYCEAVEVYYDLICYARKENKQHFKMTVELYKEWRSAFANVQSPVNQATENSLLNKISK
ncbi:hypothetical protein OCE40_27215 [Bacillus toyonensis]|uniref:DUF4760 domain-containing protein n=1 Tax=Bacillus toyonensis TaxID=155322 RepID=UPI00103D5654|nr:hypothetical protein [Bacillus toyonensis]MCU5305495.1 hypothetical protein [Bacillus toyonensis]TBX46476.1 hypothetical protein E0M44_16275 [Bacillus toyonensis]